jgi:hypothetical protein
VYDLRHVHASRENALGYADLLLYQPKGEKPSNENTCWRCGATDHFSRNYPNSEKDDEIDQKYFRGCNAVAITSMVIPPDTSEHDDLTDPLSAEEETLLLSIIKDTSRAAKAARSTGIRDNVLTAASHLPRNYVLLDGCGNANLFNNREMVSNTGKLGTDSSSMECRSTQIPSWHTRKGIRSSAKYTIAPIPGATFFRSEQGKLGDPTPGDMCERLRLGKIKNVTVTPCDVWRSKSGASSKGKTTTHKAPVVKFERFPVDYVQKHQELQVDLIFKEKVAFFLGMLIPMKCIFLAPLASRAHSVIWPALKLLYGHTTPQIKRNHGRRCAYRP